ncbi:MAG: hypothetical protein R3B72_22495 [Polyangiaceae bacterium]
MAGIPRSTQGAAAALSVAAVATVLLVPYLPTSDGPHHIFHGMVANHYGDPARGYADYLEPGRAVTSLGFHALFGVLESFLPWRRAVQAVLAIIVLVWGWSYLLFASRLRPERAALGLIGFAAALGWPLYMGLFSFSLATALGWLVLALAIGRDRWRPLDRLGLGVALLVVAMAHLFPALVVGLVLLCIVAFRSEPGTRAKEIAWLAVMGLGPLAIAAWALRGGPGELLGSTETVGLFDRFRLLAKASVSGPTWRGGLFAVAALGGLASFAVTAFRRTDDEITPLDRAVALAATLLVLAGLVAPLHVAGWEFFAPRFLPVGLGLGLLLLPVERLRAELGLALAGGWSLAAIVWAGWFHRDLEARTAVALSGLDAPITRHGPRLGVVLDPDAGLPRSDAWRDAEVPFIHPLYNLGLLYAAAQGGTPSWLFTARSALHPYVLSPAGRRAFPPVHDAVAVADPAILGDPEQRRALLDFLASLGTRYEDVILYGAPGDVAALKARGYQLDVEHEGLGIGRFQGCPFRLSLELDAPPSAPVVVRCSYSLRQAPSGEWVVPPGTAPQDGVILVDAARCLCGPVWYQIFVDRDGSATPSDGDGFCEGTDASGLLARPDAKGPGSWRCKLRGNSAADEESNPP